MADFESIDTPATGGPVLTGLALDVAGRAIDEVIDAMRAAGAPWKQALDAVEALDDEVPAEQIELRQVAQHLLMVAGFAIRGDDETA